ncbi:molybdopterin-dependent oxidoreductase [bacterium]|nr:molybdopterin-dependent oxidoreductase [bacterium]
MAGEARRHGITGAKVAVISPDFNASAIHADLFLDIEPGTDTALALGVARLIIDNDWYDADSVREQTDLRTVPQLRFTSDRGAEYAERINELLEQITPHTEVPAPTEEESS